MVQLCGKCTARKAALRRPKTFEQVLVMSVAIECGHASFAVAVDTFDQSEVLSSQALLKQPSLKQQLGLTSVSLQLCRDCFYEVFEQEVHQTIIDNRLFKPGEKVAIGASGV